MGQRSVLRPPFFAKEFYWHSHQNAKSKLVGSLSMHQRSVSLPFHRKPTGTGTKMDNPKLVGGLSMSMHQLSGAG